ncbi:MAG: FHA domain-containing protein [Motiliproteus sp.]|nr:FHA domain-containing protein [Motiliproteus sp.]
MEIIVEVVGRSGTVLERQRFNGLPITFGRSYQNHIIVSDPYADAFHGQVVDDGDGGLMLQDLGSRNGTGYGGVTLRAEQARMEAGDQITLGKSHLRVFDAAREVAEALPLSSMEGVFHTLSRFWVLMAGALLLTLMWMFERYVTQLGEFNALNHLSDLLGLFGFMLLYGGVWALVGRIVRHDPRFFGHCVIALLAIMLWRLSELGLQWLIFNLKIAEWAPYLELLLAGVVLVVVMRSSLFMATHLRRWSAHLIALALPLVLVGAGTFKLIYSDGEFRAYPRYSHSLFAPGLQLFTPLNQKQYLKEIEGVFHFEEADDGKL